jgi:polyisoprenoid-binding protein YceI
MRAFGLVPVLSAAAFAVAGCVSMGDTTVMATPAATPASVAAPAADPAKAELLARQPAGVYEVEPTHTSLTFRLSHWGLSQYTARFDRISGTIDFNPASPTASTADITVDPASISTGLPNFNTKLANDVFKADSGGTVRFVSTGLTATSPTTGVMTGNLTMAGQTGPVSLAVQFNGGQPNPFAAGRQSIGFSARGTLKRSQWGITSWLPNVGDDVEVIIEAEFLQRR